MGKSHIVNHAMKRKIVADDYTVGSKIFLIFLKKFDVLGFCGINKNKVEFLVGLVSKCVGINCGNPVGKSVVIKILFCGNVTVNIKFDCGNLDVWTNLCKFNS